MDKRAAFLLCFLIISVFALAAYAQLDRDLPGPTNPPTASVNLTEENDTAEENDTNTGNFTANVSGTKTPGADTGGAADTPDIPDTTTDTKNETKNDTDTSFSADVGDKDTTVPTLTTVLPPQSVKLTAGTSKELKIIAYNNGSKSDSYSFFIDGPKWAAISPSSFTLSSFQSKIVYLKFSPPSNISGKFNFTVTMKSASGKQTQKFVAVVEEAEAADAADSAADMMSDIVGTEKEGEIKEHGAGDESEIEIKYNRSSGEIDYKIDEGGDSDITIEFEEPVSGEKIPVGDAKLGTLTGVVAPQMDMKITDRNSDVSVKMRIPTVSDIEIRPVIKRESRRGVKPPEGVLVGSVETIGVDVELLEPAVITFNYATAGIDESLAGFMKGYKCSDYVQGECAGKWMELEMVSVDRAAKTVSYIAGMEFSTFMLGVYLSPGQSMPGEIAETVEETSFVPQGKYDTATKVQEKGGSRLGWYAVIALLVLFAVFVYYDVVHKKPKQETTQMPSYMELFSSL